MIMCAVCAAGCVYPFTAELGQSEQALVVESDIVIGGITEVTLSYVNPVGVTVPVKKANLADICVEASDGSVYTGIFANGSGRIDTTEADPSLSYRLKIHVNDTDYESDWRQACTPVVVDGITYRADEESGRFKIFLNCHSDQPYFRVDFDEKWEYRSQYEGECRYQVPISGTTLWNGGHGLVLPLTAQDVSTHRCWQSSSTSGLFFSTSSSDSGRLVEGELMDIGCTDKRLSWLYRIDVTIRPLSREKYDYLSFMEQTSGNAGDLFSAMPGQPAGNIHNVGDPNEMVVGYVDVSDLVTVRKYISLGDHWFYREANNFPEPVLAQEADWYSLYQQGYYPYRSDSKSGQVYWADKRCLDCREFGGETQMPEDWPEE